MALLTAYFDESGTHSGSRITAIGGLLGTKEMWLSVEDQWAVALDDYSEFGLTWFHSTDCDSGNGEFERVPVELRYALANRLARILADQNLLPVWSSVVTEDWDNVVNDPTFLKVYPAPLYLCFAYCAQKLAEGSIQLADGTSVAVVYSEQPEFEDRISEIWNAYRRNKRASKLSSFSTASPKDVVPLQAADLVAYEMNHDWQERMYGDPPPPLTYNVRWPLKYLQDHLRLDFGGCYDAKALSLAMDRFRETGDI